MNRQKSDIFSLEKPSTPVRSDDDLISTGGSRYAKINRLRGTSSSVFPIGCMGTLQAPIEDPPVISSKGDNDENLEDEIVSSRSETSSGDMPEKELKPKRNPLTGEGMESSDMPKSDFHTTNPRCKMQDAVSTQNLLKKNIETAQANGSCKNEISYRDSISKANEEKLIADVEQHITSVLATRNDFKDLEEAEQIAASGLLKLVKIVSDRTAVGTQILLKMARQKNSKKTPAVTMSNAIRDVLNGVLSVKAAATKYDIPRTILRRDDDFLAASVTDVQTDESPINICKERTQVINDKIQDDQSQREQELFMPSTSALVQCRTPENKFIFPTVLKPIGSSNNRRERKKKKTEILTSTPVLNRLEEEQKLQKMRKSSVQKQATVKRNIVTSPKKQINCKANDISFSDSDVDVKLTDSDDVDWFSESNIEEELAIDDFAAIDVNSFILVKFPTKKTVKYYIGCVLEVLKHSNEFNVKYLRRHGNSFTYPNVPDTGAN
ncbi:hypothetical protein RN001_000347 [Aquatica leii]|uniref:HTH psq-type domain-containing protein n=1 Tax=Aquatica leii TaxID=1421715 RepID=A0AAN7PM59_9COLE|nr:hypothetical protein RN001_000347 [Aquatica leii]